MDEDKRVPIRSAIEKLGSVKALGEHLGVMPQAISQWARTPARHAQAIARLTDIPLHELRPDIYPAPDAPAAA